MSPYDARRARRHRRTPLADPLLPFHLAKLRWPFTVADRSLADARSPALDQQLQRLEQGEVFFFRRARMPAYDLKQAFDEGDGRAAQCAIAACDDA